tara:strand:+ start:50895 stop:51611 length:717 start_codon:yes stop_codon:yes gene_type:complete
MNDTAEKILSSQEVIDYLLENPDFFLENQGLFTKINFPHESSGAISLIERQVQVLRQDQKASKETVAELAANAAANHDLLKKMQLLTLDLMKALDASELLTILDSQMRGQFGLDQIQILMPAEGSELDLPFTQYLDSSALAKMNADIINLNVYVGRIPTTLTEYFSKESLKECGSIALIKIEVSKSCSYLLLGSSDESRFQSDMATDFIEFVGGALSRLLSIPSSASTKSTPSTGQSQ